MLLLPNPQPLLIKSFMSRVLPKRRVASSSSLCLAISIPRRARVGRTVLVQETSLAVVADPDAKIDVRIGDLVVCRAVAHDEERSDLRMPTGSMPGQRSIRWPHRVDRSRQPVTC